MKTNLLYYILFLLFTGAGMSSIANRIENPVTIERLHAYADTVNIELLHAKKPSARLYSSISNEGIMFTNAQGNQSLEFFIFDLEGTLIHQTILDPKEKKTIKTLKKGIYLYDLFYKDESIERGKITIQ